MDLKEDILKQVNAGFSYQEIEQNLSGKGYKKEEILAIYNQVIQFANIRTESKKISIGTIVSIVLLIITVIRLLVRCSYMNY